MRKVEGDRDTCGQVEQHSTQCSPLQPADTIGLLCTGMPSRYSHTARSRRMGTVRAIVACTVRYFAQCVHAYQRGIGHP